jgi:anti-anti-sigma factor
MSSTTAPTIAKDNGVTVIQLGPEYENLDERLLEGLRSVALDVSKSADPPWVVIDLSNTKFFGSAFIEILFRLWNRMNSRPGGQFAISGLTSYCAEVLKITHLDSLWKIYPTRAAAVQALSSTGQAQK